MLVLSRRIQQSIVIGDPDVPAETVEVTVLDVLEDRVRLGIRAPRDKEVRRIEIPRHGPAGPLGWSRGETPAD